GRKMLPGLATSHPEERISMWMGHRPSLPDSLPVVGPSRASRNVIYAFGHGHVGMTAAPMTGKIVADLVVGRPPSIDITPDAAGGAQQGFGRQIAVDDKGKVAYHRQERR